MKKSNFVTINNKHINLDNIAVFYLDAGKLRFEDHEGILRYIFDDEHGENYQKVCAAVGVAPISAQRSDNLNVAVYAELGEKRQLVQLCNSCDEAVCFCCIHNWKVATINRPELNAVRDGVLKIELWPQESGKAIGGAAFK